MQDQELIERTRQGDNTAFGELWQRYEPQVLAVCRRYLDSPYRDPATDAHDLALETYIRALHGLHSYEDRSAQNRGFDTWLLEIARNLCLKFLARQRRRSQWQGEMPPEEGLASAELTAGIVEEREVLRIAAREINALPVHFRDTFQLYLEEYSHKQIAEALGISVENAMKRVHRARRILQTRLQAVLFADETPASRRLTPARIMLQAVEHALTEIVSDYRIVDIDLQGGGHMQVCVRVDRQLAGREQEIAERRKRLEHRPKAWRKRLELAEICYHSGRWEEAREHYEAVLEFAPRCFEAALRLGAMFVQKQQVGEAARIYRAALAQEAAPTPAALLQALLRAVEGRDGEAVAAFRQAISLAPGERAGYIGLHYALARLSRFEEQLENLTRLQALDPQDVFALDEAYTPCARLLRWDIARPLLERAVASDPHYPMAIKHLFQIRMNLGLYDAETQELAERLVRLTPEFVESWAELAWIYAETGRSEESLAVLRTFLEEHPNNAEGHAALAWRYHYLNRLEERLASARRAYALAPHHWYVCWTILLATSPQQDVEPPVALQTAGEIAARFPQDLLVLETLSRFYIHWQQNDLAVEFAERVVTLRPEAIASQAFLASVYADTGRWREAADLYARLVQSPEGRTSGHLANLAHMRSLLGEPGSEEALDEAKALAHTANEWHTLGDICEKWGRREDALGAFRLALQAPQSNATLQRVLQERLTK